MNYASLNKTDAANGPGIRVSLFVSGCQLALDGHPCPGCHNYEAWKKDYGKPFTDETKNEIIEALRPDYISGFSLLGGEPLSDFNIPYEVSLLREIKLYYPNKDIWMWTGYDFFKWYKSHKEDKQTKILISCIDTIVDGPYVESLRDPTLKFRGSSNQRIINLKDKNLS